MNANEHSPASTHRITAYTGAWTDSFPDASLETQIHINEHDGAPEDTGYAVPISEPYLIGDRNRNTTLNGNFACPIYEAETRNRRRHTCNGLSAQTMSEVRRHLTSRTHASQIPFLRLCPVCQQHVLDPHSWDHEHDRHCVRPPQRQRRGRAAMQQWEDLYNCLSSSKSYPADTNFRRGFGEGEDAELFDVSEIERESPCPGNHVVLSQECSLSSGTQGAMETEIYPSLVEEGTIVEAYAIQAHVEATLDYYDRGFTIRAPEHSSPITSAETDVHFTTQPALRTFSPGGFLPVTSETPDILPCPVSSCPQSFTGRYRRGNLSRHVKSKHGGGKESFACSAPGCDRVFTRADARLRHERSSHPGLKTR